MSDSGDNDLEGISEGVDDVEDVDHVTQHMDHDVTCPNPSVLAPSKVAFMHFKSIRE